MGPELMGSMRAQAERFGTEFVQGTVTAVDFTRRPFTVTTEAGAYHARAVIVATGASARLLGLPSERRLMGHGVSTCATCDGFFYRGRPIAVVGGGDSALEEAIFLTRFASKVTVIHRRHELRASRIMREKALANPKVEFRWNAVVDEVIGGEGGVVSALALRDAVTGERSELSVDGVFVAIGHTPNTSLFVNQLEMDANGYLVTHDGTSTSVRGVFACGDVQDHVYRQAITAAGSGCMAALDAERFIEGDVHAEGFDGRSALNPTSTEGFVSVIEDDGLPRRDRRLGQVERHAHAGVGHRLDRRRRRWMTIADLRAGPDRGGRLGSRNPVHALRLEGGPSEHLPRADNHGAGRSLDAELRGAARARRCPTPCAGRR